MATTERAMTPTELLRQWIDYFNAGDIDGLAGMYAVDAVNEQPVFRKASRGREPIRQLFETDFARARLICIEERIYKCGGTAILQRRDPMGLQGLPVPEEYLG